MTCNGCNNARNNGRSNGRNNGHGNTYNYENRGNGCGNGYNNENRGNGCGNDYNNENRGNGGGTIRALVSCIVDSCQQCEQLTQTFDVALADLPPATDTCDGVLAVGSTVPIRQCGDLNVEVIRDNGCPCRDNSATTVLLSVPIALLQCAGCAQTPFLTTAVTSVRTFALCGSEYSSFELLGSEIQSLTAVITALDDAAETAEVTVSMLVKIYVAQTVAKEVYLPIFGDVRVSTCDNGCLNTLQVAVNNVTRTGIS